MHERTAVFERGEPKFSQIREAVDGVPSPAIQSISREGDRLAADVIGAEKALELAQEFGEPDLVEKAETALNEATRLLVEWENAGDERDPDGDLDLDYFPLTDALSLSRNRELNPEQQANRLENWNVFLRFIFQDGIKTPWQAFKNLLAVVRRVRPDFLGSISATDLGILLGETKAATVAREKAIFEDLLKRWGVSGFHGLGGTKTEAARRKMSDSATGNTNRRTGTRKKKAKQKQLSKCKKGNGQQAATLKPGGRKRKPKG